MKTIKIFLASSSELKEDRKEFELAISRKNDVLKNEGIYLEMVVWEDFIDQVSSTRLQDEYNKSIRDCDIFVLMFFSKVGKFTFEEFQVAHKHFRQTGKPRIFTYFKNAAIRSNTIVEEEVLSMLNFKKKLQDIGHFVTNYENVDALKYHFSEQLIKLDLAPKLFNGSGEKTIEGSGHTSNSRKKKVTLAASAVIVGLAVIALVIANSGIFFDPNTPSHSEKEKDSIPTTVLSTNDDGLNLLEDDNQTETNITPINLTDNTNPESDEGQPDRQGRSEGNTDAGTSGTNAIIPLANVIRPIAFNVGDSKLALVFHSHSLSRKDTFEIDPNKTIEYLKNSLTRHYNITIPSELLQRGSSGGYRIEELLYADHNPLFDQGQTIASYNINPYDIIEFDYRLVSTATMACFLPDVNVDIKGIDASSPVLVLNGNSISDRVEKIDDYHRFHFRFIGECNPSSWIGKLILGDKVYYLTNPEDTATTEGEYRYAFDFDPTN